MKIIPTDIPDVLLLEPKVFQDNRGFFLENYNKKTFENCDLKLDFVQDNHSHSVRHVLRGLHYQIQQPQGKLVRVVMGSVFDVAVDLRRSSPTFGQWVGFELSVDNKRMAWIPPGFAHGFLTLSETAEFFYKTTDYYAPQHERTLIWNDPDVGVQWPLRGATPILSSKDAAGTLLQRAEVYS